MEYILGTLNRTNLVRLLNGRPFFDIRGDIRQAYVEDCLIHSYIIYNVATKLWYIMEQEPLNIPKILNRHGRLAFVTMDRIIRGCALYKVKSINGKYFGEIASDRKVVDIPSHKLDMEVRKFVEKTIRVNDCCWNYDDQLQQVGQ